MSEDWATPLMSENTSTSGLMMFAKMAGNYIRPCGNRRSAKQNNLHTEGLPIPHFLPHFVPHKTKFTQ